MKNVISYTNSPTGLNPTSKNMLNQQRILYNQNKQKTPLKRDVYSKLNTAILDDVKKYLNPDHADILINSFGNKKKRGELKTIIYNYVSSTEFSEKYKTQTSMYTLDEITEILLEKIVGLDILQPYADDDKITDIKIFGYDKIRVDHIDKGKYFVEAKFDNHEHYLELIQRFTFSDNKNYSFSNPSVDITFPFMRINIVGQDLSKKITTHIRKISKKLRYDESYLLENNVMSKDAISLLRYAYPSVSIITSGATGTGKTESVRYFAKYIPNDKDGIMIEDTPETFLDEIHPHLAFAMWQNRGEEYGYNYHIRNALRQNTDYLFIQESRGKETEEILDAAYTGHIVNTTFHGNNCRDAAERFVDWCQRNTNQSVTYFRKMFVTAFPLHVHFTRDKHKRVLNEICEVVGIENEKLVLKPIISYDSATKTHKSVGKISPSLWGKLEGFHKNYGTKLEGLENLKPLEVEGV